MKEKFGFVYIWFDRKHSRFYIGSHWGSDVDGYICSSTWMRNAFNRRPFDFKRRILVKVSDRASLLPTEQRWLDLIKECELGKRYYNLKKTANGGGVPGIPKRSGIKRSKSAIEKQRKALVGRPWSEARREAQKTAKLKSRKGRIPHNKGKKTPPATLEKMSKARKGVPWTAARRTAQKRRNTTISADWFHDIHTMHEHFGFPEVISQFTSEQKAAFLKFRMDFLEEELTEMRDAESAEDVVDALIDLIVVAIGTLDSFEVNAYKAWNEVHGANMSKVAGSNPSRPNKFGLPDLVKPEGWEAPSHAGNHGTLPSLFEGSPCSI